MGSDETIFFFQEVTLVACEGSLKQTAVRIVSHDQRRRIQSFIEVGLR